MRNLIPALLVAIACTRSTGTASAPAQPPQTIMRVAGGGSGEAFRPQGTDAAIEAFQPEVPPADSLGECNTMRTGGSGARMVMARFTARDSSTTMVTLWFDSAGTLTRFSDSRGTRPYRAPLSLPETVRDSIRRANEAAHRVTAISLDFAIDQALALNRGGGQPTDAIIGTVRQFEKLEKLGPPNETIRRVRRYCGV